MLRRLFVGGALGSALLMLAACATTSEPEGGVRIDDQNNVHPTLNSVRVIDGSLARYVGSEYKVKSALDVESTHVEPTATGFPRLTVELRNKTKVAIPVEVRASWYDASGAPTDPARSWTRIFLQPASLGVFQTVSVSSASVQYYVEVRGAE